MATVELINGYYTGNMYLTETQMQENVKWIVQWLSSNSQYKWPYDRPIAAFLGNCEQESTINPGLWESLTVNYKKGFGLVQWTPASKYTAWCQQRGITPRFMDSALKRLTWEILNEGGASDQWIPLSRFDNYTFKDFINAGTKSLNELTEMFMRCYERPSEQYANLSGRQENTRKWLAFIRGEEPPRPYPPRPTPEPMKIYLYGRKRTYRRY